MKLLLISIIILTSSFAGSLPIPIKRPLTTSLVVAKNQLRDLASLKNKRPIIVAVIDTGFGYENKGKDAKLCKFGHKDFTSAGLTAKEFNTVDPVPLDRHGHGTHVTGLINHYAGLGTRDYCIVILKYYDSKLPWKEQRENLQRSIDAINYAAKIHVDIINYSGGGVEWAEKEAKAVKKFLDGNGIFFAAAGNENANLSKSAYYPAMDDKRIISVGNIDANGDVGLMSNYGYQVSCWELGTNVEMYGMSMTGTSQSTAIATGKFVANKPCITK